MILVIVYTGHHRSHRSHLPERLEVPEFDRAIPHGGRQHELVRMERDVHYRSYALWELMDDLQTGG